MANTEPESGRDSKSGVLYCLILAIAAVGLAFSLFAVQPPHVDAEETSKIDERFRKLIPAATAIHRKEFETIGRSASSPTAESFQEQTLTAALILHKIVAPPPGVEPQFRFTWQFPRPTDLFNEIHRPVGAGNADSQALPLTMIHSERITRCEAEVNENTARGSFDFSVPELYEGSADFVARKRDEDGWQIVEFQMETIGIHVRRDAEGKWRRVNSRKEGKGTAD